MAISNPKYHQRLEIFNRMLDDDNPVRVPVLSTADAWISTNAGLKVSETYYSDIPRMKEAFDWFEENVFCDVHFSASPSHPFRLVELFGDSMFRFTDEAYQILGGSGLSLEPEEYPAWIENFNKCTKEIILPRKYPKLKTLTEDEAAGLFAQAILEFMDWGNKGKEVTAYCEETLGLPIVSKGVYLHPADFVFDSLRDFKGFFSDLRRRPEQVMDAISAYEEAAYQNPMTMGARPNDPSGVVFNPMHSPTFMNPKQFEKFYLPFMKRAYSRYNREGYRVWCYCEDDWTPIVEMTADTVEPGHNAYMFEKGDPKYLKDTISRIGCFVGGMPTPLLKTGTEEQCMDMVKWCVDELAPGGKYIFTCGSAFVDKEDCTPERWDKICRYVRDNSNY